MDDLLHGEGKTLSLSVSLSLSSSTRSTRSTASRAFQQNSCRAGRGGRCPGLGT